MKQLVCEMCGGTDLLKQDGVFVCQSCGCKYSVEEAKKMMIEGAVDVSGSTVKVDTAEKLEKLHQLAERAQKEGNAQDAKKYYEEIMTEDPSDWKASFYTEYYALLGGTIGNVLQTIEKFNKRVQSVLEQILNSLEGDDLDDAIDELLISSNHLYCCVISNLYEYKKSSAEASDEVREKVCHPVVCSILEFWNIFLTYCKNNPEAISHQQALYTAVEDCSMKTLTQIIELEAPDKTDLSLEVWMLRHIFEYYYSTLLVMQERFSTIPVHFDFTVPDVIKDIVNSIAEFWKEEIRDEAQTFLSGIYSIREEELAARKQAYWNEHAEERDVLQTQKDQLESELGRLQTELKTILEQKAAQKESFKSAAAEPIPGASELEQATQRIKEWSEQRAALGLFKGKEKARLTEEIAAETQKKEMLEETLERERAERQRIYIEQCAEIDKSFASKINLLHEKIAEVEQKLDAIKDRLENPQ